MPNIPGNLATVDQEILKLAEHTSQLLHAARQRYAALRKSATTEPEELARLRNTIGELERTLGDVRYRPHGVLGVDRPRKTKKSHQQHTLSKAKRGDVQPGHKYESRKPDPKHPGEYIYTYKKPSTSAKPRKPAPAAQPADPAPTDDGGEWYIAVTGPKAGQRLYATADEVALTLQLYGKRPSQIAAEQSEKLKQPQPFGTTRQELVAAFDRAKDKQLPVQGMYMGTVPFENGRITDVRQHTMNRSLIATITFDAPLSHPFFGKETRTTIQISTDDVLSGKSSLAFMPQQPAAAPPAAPAPKRSTAKPSSKPKAATKVKQEGFKFSRAARLLDDLLAKAREDAVEQPSETRSVRGGSGKFARVGGRDHFAAHRQTYHRKKQEGKIKGTRRDWVSHVQAEWQEVQRDHQVRLLQRLRHLEADACSMEGDELGKVQKKIKRLRRRLQQMGVAC